MKRYGLTKIRMPDETPFLMNGVSSLGRWIGKVGLTVITHKPTLPLGILDFHSPDIFWV